MILSSENLLCNPNPSYSFFFLPKSFFSLKVEELEGVNELEDYLKDSKIEGNKEYCALFKFFVNNFEKIIMDKKPKVKNKK
jgi:hypothetical protein